MESKLGNTYSVGLLRMRYLSQADNLYAQGDFQNFLQCKRMLDNFMDTITEESEAGVYLKSELDKIYSLKHKYNVELDNMLRDNAGYLEKKSAESERDLIEVNAIADMKSVCWIACLKFGLFYE